MYWVSHYQLQLYNKRVDQSSHHRNSVATTTPSGLLYFSTQPNQYI